MDRFVTASDLDAPPLMHSAEATRPPARVGGDVGDAASGGNIAVAEPSLIGRIIAAWPTSAISRYFVLKIDN
jgi:hypothetical protein